MNLATEQHMEHISYSYFLHFLEEESHAQRSLVTCQDLYSSLLSANVMLFIVLSYQAASQCLELPLHCCHVTPHPRGTLTFYRVQLPPKENNLLIQWS